MAKMYTRAENQDAPFNIWNKPVLYIYYICTERWFDAQLLTLSYREAPQRHMHFKETSFLKVDALTAFWYKLSTPDDFFEPPIQTWQVLLTCSCIMNDVGERLLYTGICTV